MITPDTPASSSTRKPASHRAPSSVRFALVPGLTAGLFGAAVSGVLNYALIGMPDDMADNLFQQGVSGLITGAIGGFLGLTLYLRKTSSVGRGNAVGGRGRASRS